MQPKPVAHAVVITGHEQSIGRNTYIVNNISYLITKVVINDNNDSWYTFYDVFLILHIRIHV